MRTTTARTTCPFFTAPSGEELRSVYQDLGTQIGFEEEHQEITALFAAAALVLMVSGATTALLWFNRFP